MPAAKEYRRIYDIPDHIGTAVNVQLMVFGNSGDRSATGVGFTRNPANGKKEFYGEFLINAQGEDVVSGVRTPMPITQLEQVMPAAYKELRRHTTLLEKHYKDIQDFEFTIENEKLFMLQTRSGKRTGYAAVVIATDLVAEKLLKPNEGLLLVDPSSLSQLLAPVFDPKEWKAIPVATKGLPASPGAASGQVVFTADEAVAWTEQGKKVVLVRKETVPDDIHGMFVSQGVLTATGGMTSHAAVVGRQMGKPAIVGASELRVDEENKVLHIDGKQLHEGDYIAFDGLSGEVKVEKVSTKPSEILQVINGTMKPEESDIYRRFCTLLSWADKTRTMGIRANADLPDQAEIAYAFGARGIGLCRTEHMFFADDRLPIVRRMILADNEADRKAAVNELRADAARRLLRRVQGDARLPGDRAHDRPAAARVPAEARRPDGRDREARGDRRQQEGTRGEEDAARPRRAAPRVQPDAGAPRLPSRDHLPGDHRDADPGDHGSGLPAEQGRAEGRSGDHDSARRAS